MNEAWIGSDFDSFLEAEGILQETERIAVKRVLAIQLQAKIFNHEPHEIHEQRPHVLSSFVCFVWFVVKNLGFYIKFYGITNKEYDRPHETRNQHYPTRLHHLRLARKK